MGDPISIRLPADTDAALNAYATDQGLTRPEAVSTIVSSFLVGQQTTPEETSRRLKAEARLTEAVLERANQLRCTKYDSDVTRQLFQWIAENHQSDYDEAVGSGASFKHRLNPLLAKRFAFTLQADYAEIRNGIPRRVDVPANSNELIKSYTLLKPRR